MAVPLIKMGVLSSLFCRHVNLILSLPVYFFCLCSYRPNGVLQTGDINSVSARALRNLKVTNQNSVDEETRAMRDLRLSQRLAVRLRCFGM